MPSNFQPPSRLTSRVAITVVIWSFVLEVMAAPEFRAMWVDAFNPGIRSAAEVTQLVADARAGHFNALIVQVRKRGDAYYNSLFEPKAVDISPPSFDPLADLIAKAHATNLGPRLEVHAWIVTYPIWGGRSNAPPQPAHPYNLHFDWLTKDNTGATWNGSQYVFDPGHPGVQEHTFNVMMDIVSRYDVDGLNFDYVRYAGNTWGYNEAAVARFNARFNRTGTPAPTDAAWMQFRRDQVTALVRKVYLSALAVNPLVKISADTICFAPGVTTDVAWTNSSAAYTSVLQDWRAWMAEGLLDLAIPMAYFNQSGSFAASWTNWNTFAKDHRYRRHVAIGPGTYLNTLSNALQQLRFTRRASPSGNFADGLCLYSYASPVGDGTPRSTFYSALTRTNVSRLYETNVVPLFPTPTNTPAMPWKITPTRGHLKGWVRAAADGNTLDGAVVSFAGPTNFTTRSDATGFYGAVDLPPGEYLVTASFPGLDPRSTNVSIAPGVVASHDLNLPPLISPLPPVLTLQPASRSAPVREIVTFQVAATGTPPLGYRWRKNGATIPGATGTNFTIGDLRPGHFGNYSVVVTNAFGVVQSTNAVLTLSTNEVPAWWAAQYFGARVDATLDHDGDGHSTLAEYLLGTVPTHAGSRLEMILRRGPGPETWQLTFLPHTTDRAYALEFKNDVGAVWTSFPSGPALTNANGGGCFTLTNPPAPRGLFRLRADWAR